MNKYIPFWVLFALVVTSDQWSKSLVVENSKELQENPIVILELINGRENLLEFTYIF